MSKETGGMSWPEAIDAMEKGLMVRHMYFTSEEHFEIRNGRIFAEDRCPMDGWYLGEEWQKSGWSIVRAARGE